MTDNIPIMNANPVGHSVPLKIPSEVQTILLGFVLGRLIEPASIQMINIKRTIKLNIVLNLLRWPMNFVEFIVRSPSMIRCCENHG